MYCKDLGPVHTIVTSLIKKNGMNMLRSKREGRQHSIHILAFTFTFDLHKIAVGFFHDN